MLWGHSANAQNSISTSNVTLAKPKKKLNVNLDLSADSNLREQADPDYSANLSLGISPSYKILPKVSLQTTLSLQQKLYADQESSISNTTFTISRDAIAISDNQLLYISASGILPSNKKDREENSFKGAGAISLGVMHKCQIYKKSCSIGYTLSYLQNFHEFERTNIGEANLENRVRHIISYSQDINAKLSLGVTSYYQTGWAYQNALKTSFLLSEELSYSASPTSQIFLNHTNNGDALAHNGVDSNLSVYDTGGSSFSTGLRVSY